MKNGSIAVVGALALCVGACTLIYAQGNSAQTLVADVSRAMGSGTLKFIQYSGNVFRYALEQSYMPGGPWPKLMLTRYIVQHDLENSASDVKVSSTGFDDRGG